MARLPRLYAPDIPQLVQARFARPLAAAHEPVPAATLDLLQEWLTAEVRLHGIALHGWVIVLDRLVLLATPPQQQGLSRTIQGLGRRLAAGLRHSRVFEGRYRSTLVEEAWVPACMVWIESLPVRQQLVDTADRWPWSSAREHVGLRIDTGALQDHAAYWGLDNTPFARQARYQASLLAGTSGSEARRIEQALFGQWALGSDEFIAHLASRCSRRASPSAPGRPRKVHTPDAVTN